MSKFRYALRAPETKRQYPQRFKALLDFLQLEGPLEQQAKLFLSKALLSTQWAENMLMNFIVFQRDRVKSGITKPDHCE